MRSSLLVAGFMAVTSAVWAECPMTMEHGEGHDMGAMKGMDHGASKAPFLRGALSPSSQALADANMRMHKDMDIVYTGDADIDFLRGMIAHHQGAIDMAKAQLAYGKDAQVKRLAREIIRAQTQEIHWMKTWLVQLEKRGVNMTPDNAKPADGWFERGWIGSTWMGER